jgi:predicted Zn-ribbon and HTH transcriptional regulator
MCCSICGLGNQVEFSAEMIVHLGGLKHLDKSGVMLFPKLLVCVSCGFSQFTVSQAELELLASDSPNCGSQKLHPAVFSSM